MNLLSIRRTKKDKASKKPYKKAAIIIGASAAVLGVVGYVGAAYDQSSLERSNTPINIELISDDISMDYHMDSYTIKGRVTGLSLFARATINDQPLTITQRNNHAGHMEYTIKSVPEGDSQVTVMVIDGKRQAKKVISLKRQTKADYDKQELEKQLTRTEEALQQAESSTTDDTIAAARSEIQRLPSEKRPAFTERFMRAEKRHQEEKDRIEKEKRAAEEQRKYEEGQKKRQEEAAAALRARRHTTPQQHTPQPRQQPAPQSPRHNSRPQHHAAPQPPAPSGPHFKSCKEARAAGYSHMRRGEPGYARHLDRDNDGIACDKHR
ncbi:MAG: excalibur calcium-binding domain-containing protein [Candidatus Saccharibacteria bacterium]|nr:excalibur calcium-binding domain-containing protein [Candidatus Saccharibacteria bacterium]